MFSPPFKSLVASIVAVTKAHIASEVVLTILVILVGACECTALFNQLGTLDSEPYSLYLSVAHTVLFADIMDLFSKVH